MQTTGRVTETFTKPWQSRTGSSITLHSFKIEGDNRYFRTGEDAMCSVNDLVTFEFDGKNQVSALEITGRADTPPPKAQAAAKQAYSSGGGYKQKQAEKDAYWSDKEARDIAREERQQTVVEPRITWASAQSDAVKVVGLALQHDLLVFGNANKGAKLGLLLDYVDQVTARFAAQRWDAAALVAKAVDIATDREDSDKIPHDERDPNDDLD